jgi:SAM-dependent methyltransferase
MTPSESPARGTDGLTAEELRRGRDDWWSASFTRALLEAIPAEARGLIEVGCGLGRVAKEVLPLAPRLSYLGVDVDAARIGEAAHDFEAGALADRTRFLVGRGEDLPLENESADVVLFCMTLQHVASPDMALREARRVLRPGGTLVAAEPDNPGQRWFFDGPLPEVTRTFSALIERCRKERAPADLAIGPRVPGLARAAGFGSVDLQVYAIFATRHESAQACADRWREMLGLFARSSGLAESAPQVADVTKAIDAWLAEGDPGRLGQCGTTAPVFITTATRE